MIAELRAVSARINALGIPCHIGQVPTGATLPYVSISAPAHDVGDELSLNGSCGVIDTDGLRVMAVDVSVANVIDTLNTIRADLSPDEHASTLAVTGRHAVVVWVRSEGRPYEDRDTTVSNRHPVVAVDTYRLVSQPT